MERYQGGGGMGDYPEPVSYLYLLCLFFVIIIDV